MHEFTGVIVHRCHHYCDHDKYPEGKPIDPTTDVHARKTDKGNWKCGTWGAEESQDLLRLMNGVK